MSAMRAWVCGAAWAGALAGCAVGPDYVRPDVNVPATYKSIDAGTEAASSKDWKPAQPSDAKPRAPWWEIYGDPQLNALEQQVATANQTVAAAAARFRGARAAVAQARSGYFPTVTANAAFNQTRASSNFCTSRARA